MITLRHSSGQEAEGSSDMNKIRLTLSVLLLVAYVSPLLAVSSDEITPAGQLSSDRDFSFDSLFEQAIDQALTGAPPARQVQEAEPEPEPKFSVEEIAVLQAEKEQAVATAAASNVVTLLASSLAQYQAPAHSCESDRTISNWVQARGNCQLNFRSEFTHQFLCTEDGKPSPIQTTSHTSINFAEDIEAVRPLRVSSDGWIALVLELKEELSATSAGDFKVNRWQFTASVDQLPDMAKLASSFQTLKLLCEKNS